MDKDIIKALQAKIKAEHQFKLLIERELELLEDILSKHPEIKREWIETMDSDSEHNRIEKKAYELQDVSYQLESNADIDINDDGTVVIR